MANQSFSDTYFSTFTQAKKIGPKLDKMDQPNSSFNRFLMAHSQNGEDSLEFEPESPRSRSPTLLATPVFTPPKAHLQHSDLKTQNSNEHSQYGDQPAVSPILITSEGNLSSQLVNVENRTRNDRSIPRSPGNSPGSFSGGLRSPELSVHKQSQPIQDHNVLNRYTADVIRNKAHAWQSPPNSRQFSEIDVARFEAYQREAELLAVKKQERNASTTAKLPAEQETEQVPLVFRQLYLAKKPAALNVSFNGTAKSASKQIDDSRGLLSRRSLVSSQMENQNIWREILTVVDSLVQKSFSWPTLLNGQDRYNLISVIDTAAARKKFDILSTHLGLLTDAKDQIPKLDRTDLDKLASLMTQIDHHKSSLMNASETMNLKDSSFSDLIGKVHRDTTILVNQTPNKESEQGLPQGKCLMYCDKMNGRTIYLSEKEVSTIKNYYSNMMQRAPENIHRYICSFEEYMEHLLQYALHPCEAANHKDQTNSEVYLKALNAYKKERRLARN